MGLASRIIFYTSRDWLSIARSLDGNQTDYGSRVSVTNQPIPEGLEAVSERGTRIASASTIESVSERTREAIEEFLSIDQFQLFLANEDGLVPQTSIDQPGQVSGNSMTGFETLAEDAFDSGDARLIQDRFRATSGSNLRSVLTVPLGDYGALQVGAPANDVFSEDALALVEIVGRYTSFGIENAGYPRTGNDSREPDQAHKRYQTLVDQFPNGIVTLFDEDHRYQLAGGTGFDQLSVSADRLEGRTLADVFPSEQAGILGPIYDQAFHGESSTAEVTLENRVFRIHVVPVTGEDGDVLAGMTMSQDITEQKEHERELERARKRYQTLLRAAPDPIFVADAYSGEIVEANEAAEKLRGQPIEEIVGLNQTELHPAEDADLYRELFAEPVQRDGPVRQLPDGSQVKAVNSDGETIPVEINVGLIDLDHTAVVYGIFRDISDQLEYERALRGLNEASRGLFEANRIRDIREVIVETVTGVLDRSGAVIYRYDNNEGVLVPATRTLDPEFENRIGDLPESTLDASSIGRAFTESRTTVLKDGWADEDFDSPENPYRSGVAVPLGKSGVLVVFDSDPTAFDDRSINLIEILGLTAEVAIDRTETESRIRNREKQLKQRSRRLEEVESLNARIRNVTQAIVKAETRQEVERAVCSELVNIEQFELVWIGDPDSVSNRLEVRESVGDAQGYLEVVSLELNDVSESSPPVTAARTQEQVVISTIASNASRERWRSEAIARGYKSVMSLPLLYQGSLQGVLSIFSNKQSAFSGIVRSVLAELGELIAHALVAIDRKKSLLSNQQTVLDFDVRDQACFFLRFAQQTRCSLELRGVIPQPDESYLVFVNVEHGSPDELVEQAERASAIDNARIIESDGDTLIQLSFIEPFIASILAEQGLSLKSIRADSTECRVTVAAPTSFDTRQVVDVVASRYPNSELIGKREVTRSRDRDPPFHTQFISELTPRQREVVELAYLSGYFDTPKKTGAEELSSELDFSISAFHRHIRTAERKLFETIFANSNYDETEYAEDPP